MAFLSAVALGIPTWNGLSERGWRSVAGVSDLSAAENSKADETGAASQDESSDRKGNERPVGAPKSDADAIEFLPRPTKNEAKVFEALGTPTSVEFEDAPFENCMKFLKDYHKINIWLDRAALTDEGVALDQPITLKLAGTTLRSILKLLLEPVQLTYVIEDDVMKITTSERAAEKLMTRTYPVHDLYRGRIVTRDQPGDEKGAPRPPSGESLPGDLETAITKTIDPKSWDVKHGFGSMTYVSEAGSLVIRQTPAAHEQILQMLRDLREARRAGQVAPQGIAPARTGWKIHGPKRAETVSIVGIMDLDGDGEDDRARLRRVIEATGGSIDNEVDEQGVLRVDGRIPDDGKPCITDMTKFVVVGKIPQAADLSDPDEIATSLKIGGFYKDLEDQARARGVQIVGLEDFLRYIGYEPLHN